MIGVVGKEIYDSVGNLDGILALLGSGRRVFMSLPSGFDGKQPRLDGGNTVAAIRKPEADQQALVRLPAQPVNLHVFRAGDQWLCSADIIQIVDDQHVLAAQVGFGGDIAAVG